MAYSDQQEQFLGPVYVSTSSILDIICIPILDTFASQEPIFQNVEH